MYHKPKYVKIKTLSLFDYIIRNDFDIVALMERPNGKRGGGFEINYKSSIDLGIISLSRDTNFATFENMSCTAVKNIHTHKSLPQQ